MTRRFVQWLTLLAAIAILVAVLFFNRHLIARQLEHAVPPQPGQTQYPDVSVLTVSATDHNAIISGFGETATHFTLTLTAQTNGQVIEQAKIFEPGCRVTKGNVLIQLEDSDYQSAVADAESTLASARLALLEEQREATQAQAEWKASGLSGEPDSALVLHQPQLLAAKAAVTKAEAALTSAVTTLSRTRITAPFDAIVVERLTAPGSYVQAGTEVATLYSTDMIEVGVPLSTKDWNHLPDSGTLSDSRWPVQLVSVENGQTWSGYALRAEQHVDGTSRQRSLLIAVDSPLDQNPPLLPGTFVEARISGSSVSNVWELPSSALSQRGEVWYVTDNNTLAKFSTETVFSSEKFIYVEVPEELSANPVKIVVHPLSSYLPGMIVKPSSENHNA
jgi:RND family efflux transporter MFP subunit